MKQKFDAYFLGLDIGTESVGWAACSPQYELLSRKGKNFWGSHLFDEAMPAADRRVYRSARRRLERRGSRLALLQHFFADEIGKIDTDFFQRLKDSMFFPDDKELKQKYSLFSDENYTDLDYHKEFPTIYHLRKELMENKNPHDPRLVYLALHHLLKHRGHFIFEGQDLTMVTSFQYVFEEFLETAQEFDYHFDCYEPSEVEEILKDEVLTKKDKKKKLLFSFGLAKSKSPTDKALIDLISGLSVTLSKLFDDESLADAEISKISLADGIDEQVDLLTDMLEDRMTLILKAKALYDWSLLVKILGEYPSLSYAKVQIHQEHQEDLTMLKSILKKYGTKDLKNLILRDDDTENNYPSYLCQGKKSCSQGDFNKFLEKKCKDFSFDTEEEGKFYQKIKEGKALPKQVTKDNSVIPYQVHLMELRHILENAKGYLPFLEEKDQSGLSVSDKIISIFTFRIPYYVGPLNPHGSENAWIQRKESGKIYPWNFEEKVDLEKSAEKFITRMTNQCTYLVGSDADGCSVLPKQSISYSKFVILNQLNNLRVDGELLPVPVKQDLFQHFYMDVSKTQKLTLKQIASYFKSKGFFPECTEEQLSGVDGAVLGSMKPFHQLNAIFGEDLPTTDILDRIIRDIVILGESKDLLGKHLKKEYGFSPNIVSKIKKCSFSGWGNLSLAFLTKLYHTGQNTGECFHILEALYETQDNLMQLLSTRYEFTKKITQWNEEHGTHIQGLNADVLKDLYVSPAIRRSIWRAISLTQEVVKITGHPPEKIFVETAREVKKEENKGKRTTSRKERLIQLYKSAKLEKEELFSSLEQQEESRLRDNRLYLYYAQLGRCMYSWGEIPLEQLESNYDLDHIYPQSKVKDDSILNNLVLARRDLNGKKDDSYPIPESCLSSDVIHFWRGLKEKGLINSEKYNRLTRRTEFSLDEMAGFINRQLVETRQSSKAVASILKKMYPDTEIVYVKAENVSTFRYKYGFLKSRLVNMFHHAHDAYLNIVVGNVYHEKFTSNPRHFLNKNQKYTVNADKIFEYPVKNGLVWDGEDGKSIAMVKSQMAKNMVNYTRYAHTSQGGFYDQNPVSKGKGQLPLKTSDPRLHDISKYGGYNSVKGAYFFYVQHTEKKKRVRSIEFVSILEERRIHNQDDLLFYAENSLKLVEPRILIPKIKKDTLFKVDGFLMHLSSRTGNRIVFKNAMPLIVSTKEYQYIRDIEKHYEKNREVNSDRKKANLPPLPPHSRSKISVEENLKIYDLYTHKLKNTLYFTRLSAQVPIFEQGRELFTQLSLWEQCQFLYSATRLFGTSPSGKDLTLIGGSKNAGIMLLNSTITEKNRISILFQSVTGLFCQEIDLNDPKIGL